MIVVPKSVPRVGFPAAILIVVSLFCVEVWLSVQRLHNYHIWAPTHPHDAFYRAAIIALAIVQSIALLLLHRSLSLVPRIAFAWVAAAVVIVSVVSLLSPDTEIGNRDAYAYMGYAKLPTFADAYAPPPYTFTGPGFDTINKEWRQVIFPAYYGPLWLLYDRLTLANAATAWQALLIMRMFNIAFLLALVLTMLRLRLPSSTLVLVILNPMLWYYYVVEAHNDMSAILLVVMGMLIAEKRPWLGTIVAGAAGLIKIPYTFIAAAALGGRRDVFISFIQSALVVIVVALGSILLGGAKYLHTLTQVSHTMVLGSAGPIYTAGLVLHACVLIIAAAALIASQFGTFIAPATYSLNAISPNLAPWYLGWCIPYALRGPRFTASFFISLPAVAHMIFDPHGEGRVLADLYFAVVIAFVVRYMWLSKARQRTMSAH